MKSFICEKQYYMTQYLTEHEHLVREEFKLCYHILRDKETNCVAEF